MHKPEIGSVTKKIVGDDQFDNEEMAQNIISLNTSLILNANRNSRIKPIIQKENSNGIHIYSRRNFGRNSCYQKGSYMCKNPTDSIINNNVHSSKIERLHDFERALTKIEKSTDNPLFESCISLNSSFKNFNKSRYSSVKSRYQSIRMSFKLNQNTNEEFSFSPSININKSQIGSRSRSLNQFLECQSQFLNKKDVKIAHQHQKELSMNEKIRRNSFVTKQLSRVSSSTIGLTSVKRSSIQLCSEKNLNVSRKVKLSDFQQYVKDNLFNKTTCNHFSKRSYVPQIRVSHQNILYKKMLKDIDKILVKNRIFSNKLAFNDMAIVFENLGFKSKVESKEQSNALNVIWKSINIQGENTIDTKELKIAIMALSNIKIPKNSMLYKDHLDLNNSKNDLSTSDNSQSLKSKISNSNIFQLNHIRREKRIEVPPIARLKDMVKNSRDDKQKEIFCRLTKKINLNNSMQKVVETRNSPTLNIIDDSNKNCFDKTQLNQISHPKFKILDKKPYMLLNSECTFTPIILGRIII